MQSLLVQFFRFSESRKFTIPDNSDRARPVWCLFSKNGLEHFVLIEKSKQFSNSLTFPFLGDTELQFAQLSIMSI